MNRLSLFSLISCIALLTFLMPLEAMKRTHNAIEVFQQPLSQEQTKKSVIEILCCLYKIGMITDTDPIIIQFVIFTQTRENITEHFDTKNPKTLCFSLLKSCEKLPDLVNRFMPFTELGSLVAYQCAQKGINLENFSSDDKTTILHCLALTDTSMFNQETIIKVLTFLCSIENINKQKLAVARDDFKYTALHYAVTAGHDYFIKHLINTPGINAQELVMIHDCKEHTAFDIAKHKNNHTIIALLQPYTAKNQ